MADLAVDSEWEKHPGYDKQFPLGIRPDFIRFKAETGLHKGEAPVLGRLLTRVQPAEVSPDQHLPLFMLSQTIIHELLAAYRDQEDNSAYTDKCVESVKQALAVNEEIEDRLRHEYTKRKKLQTENGALKSALVRAERVAKLAEEAAAAAPQARRVEPVNLPQMNSAAGMIQRRYRGMTARREVEAYTHDILRGLDNVPLPATGQGGRQRMRNKLQGMTEARKGHRQTPGGLYGSDAVADALGGPGTAHGPHGPAVTILRQKVRALEADVQRARDERVVGEEQLRREIARLAEDNQHLLAQNAQLDVLSKVQAELERERAERKGYVRNEPPIVRAAREDAELERYEELRAVSITEPQNLGGFKPPAHAPPARRALAGAGGGGFGIDADVSAHDASAAASRQPPPPPPRPDSRGQGGYGLDADIGSHGGGPVERGPLPPAPTPGLARQDSASTASEPGTSREIHLGADRSAPPSAAAPPETLSLGADRSAPPSAAAPPETLSLGADRSAPPAPGSKGSGGGGSSGRGSPREGAAGAGAGGSETLSLGADRSAPPSAAAPPETLSLGADRSAPPFAPTSTARVPETLSLGADRSAPPAPGSKGSGGGGSSGRGSPREGATGAGAGGSETLSLGADRSAPPAPGSKGSGGGGSSGRGSPREGAAAGAGAGGSETLSLGADRSAPPAPGSKGSGGGGSSGRGSPREGATGAGAGGAETLSLGADRSAPPAPGSKGSGSGGGGSSGRGSPTAAGAPPASAHGGFVAMPSAPAPVAGEGALGGFGALPSSSAGAAAGAAAAPSRPPLPPPLAAGGGEGPTLASPPAPTDGPPTPSPSAAVGGTPTAAVGEAAGNVGGGTAAASSPLQDAGSFGGFGTLPAAPGPRGGGAGAPGGETKPLEHAGSLGGFGSLPAGGEQGGSLGAGGGAPV